MNFKAKIILKIIICILIKSINILKEIKLIHKIITGIISHDKAETENIEKVYNKIAFRR